MSGALPMEAAGRSPRPEPTAPLAIGGMRFSLVTHSSLGGWKATHQISLEESAEIIFADARLEARFALFEAITLPFFRYAAEQNAAFRLCILASSLMPKPWRRRLDALIADIPQISRIYVKPDQRPMHMLRSYVRERIEAHHESLCTFRIDDDDCLYKDYFENIETKNAPEFIDHVISHENGLYIAHSPERGLIFKDVAYRAVAIGLANISSAKDCVTIYALGNHAKLPQRKPFEVFDAPRAWIRSVHGTADTAARKYDFDTWSPLTEIEEEFRRLYPFIDLEQMAEALRRAAK